MVVRRESVVLDLQDRFTGPMARPIAATALLKRNLDDLDGTATKLGRDGGLKTVANKTLPDVDKNARKADQSINQLTGRLRLLARASAILGPGLVPVGGAALPGIAALATQAAAGASAIGVIALAVNGLGDGLKALNEYQLEPTADNLAKVRAEFAKLGPDGADFVRYIDEITPKLQSLQLIARAGMLPGFEIGLDAALERLPRLQRIVGEVSTAVGRLGKDAGQSIGGPEWGDFFRWLDQEAAPIVDEFGRTLGNFTLGLANLLVAFSPLSSAFSGGLLEMSRAFADWSAGLDENQGFQKFLGYIEENGPRVLDLVGALIDLLAGVVEAAAPVGAVVVPILTQVLDVFAAVASSDLGTPIIAGMAALSAYNQALLVTTSLQAKMGAGSSLFGPLSGPQAKGARAAIQGARADVAALGATWATAGARTVREQQRMSAAARSLRGNLGTLAGTAGRVGAPIAGIALAASGAADGFDLANTATYALMGTWLGPWGTAAGAAVGATMDLAAANNDLEAAVAAADEAIASGQVAAMEQRRADLEAALASHDDDLSVDSTFDIGGQLSDPLQNLGALKAGFVELTGGADEARGKIKELDDAIADAPNAFAQAAEAQKQYAGASRGAALADTAQARALEQATSAMRAKREETLRGLNAELDYKGAVLDARAALKENGKTVNDNTRKGQDNLRALYSLAGAWNDQSNKVKGASGALREARANFIDTAQAMGMSEDKAKRLAQRLFEIPKERVVYINLPGMGEKLAATQRLKDIIDSYRDQTVTITTVYKRVNSASDALPDRGNGPRAANGTTVPKTGRGYADRHHYLLADGEEVISNRYGQADRHRSLLKAINANRMAAGGTAGSQPIHVNPGRNAGQGRGGDGFDLTIGVDRVRSELDDLRDAVRKAGRHWTGDLARMSKAAIKAAKEYEQTTAQLKTAKQNRAAYAQEVASAYTGDIFGNGIAGLSLQLQADTNDANATKANLAMAKKKGLVTKDDPRTKGVDEGAFYRELAASGDTNTIQQLANASSAEIARIQAQYQQRQSAVGGLGGYAAGQQSDAAIKELASELRDERRENRRLTRELRDVVKTLPKHVRDGAEDGTRKGNGDKARRTGQGVKAGR